jgi:hypothetical protein
VALYEQLRDNARPQNRAYLYDYFWDNCSTRVRDALDRVLGGRVRAAAAARAPARMSLRANSQRLVADLAWEYVALHFGLGSLTDRPITVWDEAFIPERLRDLLRVVRVPGGSGERPLVKSERILFRAHRPDPPPDPPRTLPVFAAIGAAAGAALFGLARLGRRRRSARLALGVAAGGIGLVAGLLGVILLFLWFFTDHRAAHANANVLQATPLALGLVVLAAGVARGRISALRRARLVALAAAASAALGLALKATAIAAQDNLAFIALFLPVWAGLAWGLGQLAKAAAPGGGGG